MQQVLVAAVGVVAAFALGCGATSVVPGLANAPALGGAQIADPRGHDVIANGLDSCGTHLDPGPLRYRVPPCPSVVPVTPKISLAPAPEHDVELELQWVRHYYEGWPCPHPKSLSDGERLTAWGPTDLRASHCDLP